MSKFIKLVSSSLLLMLVMSFGSLVQASTSQFLCFPFQTCHPDPK